MIEPHNRTGTGYLQVRPHPQYQHDLKVVKVTQKFPDVIEPGCVVIKLRIQVPNSAFGPLRPEVDLRVPEENVYRPGIVESLETDPDAD